LFHHSLAGSAEFTYAKIAYFEVAYVV